MRAVGAPTTIPEEESPCDNGSTRSLSESRTNSDRGSNAKLMNRSASTLQHIADRVETRKTHGLSIRSYSSNHLRDLNDDGNLPDSSSEKPLNTPNSSSTIYVDQTITNLDETTIARRPSSTDEALRHIEQDASEFASSGASAGLADIREYMERLFVELALDDGIAVIILVYLDRIERHAGLSVSLETWKWLMSGAILTAAKIWDDVAFWLADFPVTANADIGMLNAMERAVLGLLRYDVSVSPREYAEAYFVLRDHVPATARVPLDKARAQELGLVSPSLPHATHRRRSNSVDSANSAKSQPRTTLATLPLP